MQESHLFLCTLRMAVVRSSSGGVTSGIVDDVMIHILESMTRCNVVHRLYIPAASYWLHPVLYDSRRQD